MKLLVFVTVVMVLVADTRIVTSFQGSTALASPSHDIPLPCDRVIVEATRRSKAHHKLLIVKFGSSWCKPCKALSAMIHDKELWSIVGNHYDYQEITFAEDAAHKDQENPGAEEWLKHNGLRVELPTLAIVSNSGAVLSSSQKPSKERELPSFDGPPYSFAQIGSVLHFLVDSSGHFTSEEKQSLRSLLLRYLDRGE